ncbi:MAG: transglutaminase domain-containing protein [Wujia sp.]
MKKILVFFMCVIFFFTNDNIGNLTVTAKETDAETEMEDPEIIRVEKYADGKMSLDVNVTYLEFATYYIYRSKSKNTGFKCIDKVTVDHWTGTDSYSEISGEKKKVYMYLYGRKGKSLSSTEYESSSFIDNTAKFGITYYYRIRMKYDGKMSGWSNTCSGKIGLDSVLPLGSYAKSNHEVVLKWNKVNYAKGYFIYQKKGKKWVKIATVPANMTAYSVRNLTPNKKYQFFIETFAKVKGKTIRSTNDVPINLSTKNPTVKGDYKVGSVYGPRLNQAELLDVQRVAQAFKDNYIDSKMTAYEKAETAFLYLQYSCGYAYNGWQYNQANTAWGALVYGEAQCSGYARAYKALCDAAGIPCYYVHANSKAINPSHQWNMVQIDKKWYIVDAQSGCFLVGSNTWKAFGFDWDQEGLPTCNKKNYIKK